MKIIKRNIFILLSLTTIIISCKKDQFTIAGVWKVNYHFTLPGTLNGTFEANLKTNGYWDAKEQAKVVDEGTWTTNGDSITIRFSKSGPAIYRGIKNSDNELSGTIGDSPLVGVWNATK